ncbi:isocitrate lyase/PEP mutase family protein [Agromyces humatus]|uniref:Isocitrate lyase/phosphoenolpyruvate mutase family protein n=1 Tax=Agromyces humatus TaxID=279573 RepID=A0ABP4X5V8_9MICO|nr:isocitrate lyase/phosphoenolpyruvate mutase family protein [Agromyces humatus]
MLTPTEFRNLHRPGSPLFLPNAWDLASARWLHASGHPVVGTTSLGVAFTAGPRDGAGEIAEDTLGLVRRIAGAGIAVTADIEAGFSSDPAEVASYVAELAGLGAVGVNIEDSDTAGQLVDPSLAAAKISAIAAAVPNLYLNARTDVFWIGGDADTASRHADAVARADRYLAAGATGVFVPGVLAPATVSALTASIAAPLNVLVQQRIPVAELARLGVARVSTGSLLFRAALGALAETATSSGEGELRQPTSTPSYDDVVALD